MFYSKFGDVYAVRLEKGEEISECIKRIARENDITLGVVSGIGASNDATLGVLDLGTGVYERTEIKEDCEITSLIGNITVKNGEPYVHLHITVAGKGGNVYGGHLLKTVISATAEIFITVLPGTVERFESDSSPKLNLMKL